MFLQTLWGATQIQQDGLAKESKLKWQNPLKIPCEIYNALVAALYLSSLGPGEKQGQAGYFQPDRAIWAQSTRIYAFRAHQSKPEAEQPPITPAPRKNQSSTNPPFHIPSSSQAGWKPSRDPAERKNRMFSCTRNL